MVAQGWLPAADRAQAAVPRRSCPRRRRPAASPATRGGHVYKLAMDELAARGITEQEINTEGLHDRPDDRLEAPGAGRRRGDEGAQGPAGATCGARWCRSTRRPAAILAYYGGDERRAASTTRRPGASPARRSSRSCCSAALQDSRQNVGLGSTYDGSSPQNFLGVQVGNSEGFSCNPLRRAAGDDEVGQHRLLQDGHRHRPAAGGRRRAPGRDPGRRAAQPDGGHRAGRQGGPPDRHGVGVRDVRGRRDPPRRPTWSRR